MPWYEIYGSKKLQDKNTITFVLETQRMFNQVHLLWSAVFQLHAVEWFDVSVYLTLS
jgi:hypothetical protein